MSKIEVPTLSELREFIEEKGLERWANYGMWGNGTTVADYFSGNCHYAAKALGQMMDLPRSAVTRGWYTQVDEVNPIVGWIRNASNHIAHTWLQYDGKIIDPTWWAFHPKESARVYVFNADDERYHTKDPV